MARGRDRRGRFLKRRATRRRSRRRNAPLLAVNPRRRRRRSSVRRTTRRILYRAAPRRRSRRRRNPGRSRRILGNLGSFIPPPRRIAAGVAGAAATRVIPAVASRYLPMIPTTGIAGLGVKAAAAVVGGAIVARFYNRQVGEDMALGGLIVVADEAARTFVYPSLPLPGLSAFLGMGQYLSPGATVPALPPFGEDFDQYDDLSGFDVPARLDTNERL
jgi:hypothetical protein